MSYTIQIADVNDERTESELRTLIKAAFDSATLLPPGHLKRNISSNASQSSFFLVAIEDNQIIGCNAFLAYDFTLKDQVYVGYQSCWSATHPAHQGKKVFVTIINEAKKMLKSQGAGFLYGIPNNTSLPIFTKKLEFSETPAMMSRVFNIPFFQNFFLSEKSLHSLEDAFIVNEDQVMRHKLLQSPTAIKQVSHKKSTLWGKSSSKSRYGLNIPYFELGGIQLADVGDLRFLINAIFEEHKPWFIQVISCQTNTYNGLFKRWTNAHMNGFIFYNLNMPKYKNFNIMIGTIDVF